MHLLLWCLLGLRNLWRVGARLPATCRRRRCRRSHVVLLLVRLLHAVIVLLILLLRHHVLLQLGIEHCEQNLRSKKGGVMTRNKSMENCKRIRCR